MLNQKNEKIIDDYDYLSNATSSMDCTGLIPSLAKSEDELNPTMTCIPVHSARYTTKKKRLPALLLPPPFLHSSPFWSAAVISVKETHAASPLSLIFYIFLAEFEDMLHFSIVLTNAKCYNRSVVN